MGGNKSQCSVNKCPPSMKILEFSNREYHLNKHITVLQHQNQKSMATVN